MTDSITLTGLVATVPYVVDQADKVPFVSFRLASNQRYYDRRTSQWVAGDTNWYTITAFRALAVNAAASITKGDRVLVTGRLKVRRWESGEKNGISVDVEADSIGHDLLWGTTRYARTAPRDTSAPADAVQGDDASASSDTGSLGTNSSVGPEPAQTSLSGHEVWPVTTPGRQVDDLVGADVGDTPF